MTRQPATPQTVTLQDAAERTADPQEPCRSRTNVSLSDMEVVIHNLMCCRSILEQIDPVSSEESIIADLMAGYTADLHRLFHQFDGQPTGGSGT